MNDEIFMKTTDPLPDEICSEEYELAKDIVDKIMSSDPVTTECIKQLFKQRKDALFYKDKLKISKDIFQIFIDNGIIDESAKISGTSNTMRIERQAVWFMDIGKLLENN